LAFIFDDRIFRLNVFIYQTEKEMCLSVHHAAGDGDDDDDDIGLYIFIYQKY